MATRSTDSYFARALKKIPLIGSAVNSIQNYYFNKGLSGGKEDIVIKAQKKLQSIKPRPIDFSSFVNRIDNPIVRTPVSFFSTALSEMMNVPTRLAHYGYRLGEADKPQELIGATAGIAGAMADFPMAGMAFNLGKQTLKNIGKQSISSLLKQGIKKGAKSGALLGSLYGLEEAIDAPSLQSQAISGLRGGITGGVAGSVLGGTLAGAGVGLKALKDYSKYLGDINYKPAPAYRGGNQFEYQSSIKDILKNKKRFTSEPSLIKPDYDLIEKELISEMKNSKKFDKTRFEKVFQFVKNNLGVEDIAEAKYKATTGSGLQFDEFWRIIKTKLNKKTPNKGFKKISPEINEAIWKERLLDIDEQIGIQKPKQLLGVEKVIKPTLSEVVEAKTRLKADKNYTQIKNYSSIDSIIKISQDPITQLKRSLKRSVGTPNDVAEVFSDVESKLINIGRSLQESAAKKGITNDELYDLYTSGNHKGIEGEAALLKEVHKVLRSVLPEGTKLDNIENYMHRFSKNGPMELVEMFPNTYFDEVDMSGGFKKYRSGKMTEFETDIPTVLRQVGREILYDKYKDFFEADATGQTVAKIRAKRSFVRGLIEDIKKNKNLLKDEYNVAERARKVVISDYKSRGAKPPRIKIVKGKVDSFSFFADTQTENLRKGNIYETFRPLRQSWLTTYNIFDKHLGNGIDYRGMVNALYETGRKNAPEVASALLKRFKGDPEGLENALKLQIYRNVKSEALDKVVEFLGTHRFENNNLQKVAEWTLLREIAIDVLPKDIVHKTLGAIRQTYYRGAIGFNIRSALNNILEMKRGVAVGSVKDIPDALKAVFNKNYRKKILAKYGQAISDVYEVLDKRSGAKRAKGFFAKIDPIAFKMFQDSENLKDAFLIEMLVRDGQRKGLTGEALDNFVIDGFDKFAHKYGTWGTVGIFRNDLYKTLGQFSQYPIKEAGLILKQSQKAVRGIKNLLQGEAFGEKEAEGLRYMAKLIPMNIALTMVLGSLYNATWEEIWGATPFTVSKEGKVQPQFSPIVSLITNLDYAVRDYLEGVKEGRSELLSGQVKKDLGRSLALMVPGGNQFFLKTGRAISDILRGYNQTASGNLRFLAPEGALQTLTALTMGPYSTQNAASYFNNEERAFGEEQTKNFKTLWDMGDKEGARAYYNQIMADRDKERAEKRMIEAIQKGTYTGNPSDYDLNTERKRSIFDLIAGGFSNSKDIKKALNENEVLSAPYTTSEVNEAIKEYDEVTINDILQKEAEKKAKYALINKVFGNKAFAGLTEQQKMRYLQAKGITEEDLYGWQMYKLKNIEPKEKARYIISNKITDFAKLYEEGVIQFDDLKELQRQGYIDSAKDLWEKLKMTDVYYQQETLRKLKIKYGKKLIKNKYDTMIKVQKQFLDNMMDKVKAVPTYKPVSIPSDMTTNYASKLRSRL